MGMKITQTQVEEIIDQLADFGVESEESFRSDYSGRGMYGKTCIGFVIDRGDIMTLGFVIGRVLGDEGVELTRQAATDSMGLGMIVYFPGVTLDVG